MDNVTSESKPAVRSIRSGRTKRRRRGPSLEAEIRASARQIHETGMAEAMKAAALLIVARKLDEVRTLLMAAGYTSSGAVGSSPGTTIGTAAMASPPAAAVKNPCKLCGRAGIYKSKPNQFDRTGSWLCRIHMALGTAQEAEDAMDRHLTPPPMQAAPAPQASAPVITTPVGINHAPGASSLAEAMMGAQQVENE